MFAGVLRLRRMACDVSATASHCCKGGRIFTVCGYGTGTDASSTLWDGRVTTCGLQGPRVGLSFPGPRSGLFPTGRPALPFPDRVPRALSPGPGFRAVAVPVRRCGLSEAGAPRPCRGTSQSRPHTAVTLSVAPPYCLGRTAAVRPGCPARPDPPTWDEGNDWCAFTGPRTGGNHRGLREG